MTQRLNGKKIAILAADGFEQVELLDPRQALDENGATTHVVSPSKGEVKGWDSTDWGQTVSVDTELESANPEDYDALLLPGGVMNPDQLRRDENARSFVRHFFDNDKPVAAICHAPWTLIDSGCAAGRKLTSYHTIQEDLKNAGADWVDEEVVVDRGLVTSRNPDDIPAFNEKMVETFSTSGKSVRAA